MCDSSGGVRPQSELLVSQKKKDVLVFLQTASVVVSLPILFIGVMMAASLTILLFRRNK